MSENNKIPEGLHAISYARQILEEHLGWPSKGNMELVADCLTSIAKAKKLTLVKAHGYLTRAVTLAKEQGIEVNYFFFSNGEYMNVRPHKSLIMQTYIKDTPEEKRAFEIHQKTPEYQEAVTQYREAFKKLAEKYPSKRVQEGAAGKKVLATTTEGESSEGGLMAGQAPTQNKKAGA